MVILCLAAFFLFPGAEYDEAIPIGTISDTNDFSRPLRSRRIISTEHPAFREVLPPFYTRAVHGNGPSLLNPRDLDRELTQYYINQYTTPAGLEWIRAVMVRGGPYLGFIRQEIAERNLPEELIYLPVIESGYLATALSRSGAMGLWQFMRNSIAPFDITINDWMDERRDFWKSTQAALRKLQDNYDHFGDWPLALAAYNAGLGGVSGVVRDSGIRDYWLLSERKLLKTETIHYVPKLLAVAHILSNPRQFGLVLWPEDPKWTRITLDRTVDLNLLAKEAGIDPGELKNANRELSYNVTPPGKGYLLKVREQDAEKINSVLMQGLPLINYYIHTIRSGDTLLALALRYGVSVDQITSLNPGVQARYLRIGETLMIPAIRDIPVSGSNSGSDTDFSGTHLVKQGETLWSISLGYGISPEALAEANNMRLNDILREGRVLKTPIRE